MALLTTTAGGDVATVLLAALNVLQTVALAYLAAERRHTSQARRRGVATRRDDPPATKL